MNANRKETATVACRNGHQWTTGVKWIDREYWLPVEANCPQCGRIYLYEVKEGAK